jgi:hypothetical protein
MKFIGIDPGTSGGIAILRPGSDAPTVAKMPETEAEVCRLLAETTRHASMVVLEKVGGYIGGGEVCSVCHQPKNQSPGSSMFNFGRGVGVIAGCLHALGCKFVEAEPQRWQKALGLKRPQDMTPDDWKRELKKHAQQMYPTIKITLATCDAILLARYAMLLHEGIPAGEPLDSTDDILFGA